MARGGGVEQGQARPGSCQCRPQAITTAHIKWNVAIYICTHIRPSVQLAWHGMLLIDFLMSYVGLDSGFAFGNVGLVLQPMQSDVAKRSSFQYFLVFVLVNVVTGYVRIRPCCFNMIV